MMKFSASIDALDAKMFQPTWRVTIIAEDTWGHKHEVATEVALTKWGARRVAVKLLRRRKRYMSRMNKAQVLW